MNQLQKVVAVSLIIVLSLTSDTALRSTAESTQNSSTNSSTCGDTGRRPRYWGYRSWMFPEATLPCE